MQKLLETVEFYETNKLKILNAIVKARKYVKQIHTEINIAGDD